MTGRGPLPRGTAFAAVARCIARTGSLLARRRVHLPRENIGTLFRFADGSTGRVYRETKVDHGPVADPCILVVTFRLRRVRGWGHTAFRWESILNTPLFVGFPGFVSKLWLAHDEHGNYRGLYEWDGPQAAAAYAGALWRVLALVSVQGSIAYEVVPGLRRNDLLAEPRLLDGVEPAEQEAWWRLVQAA